MFGSLILVQISRSKKLKTSCSLGDFYRKECSLSSQHNIQAQHPFNEEARYYFGQIVLQTYFVR